MLIYYTKRHVTSIPICELTQKVLDTHRKTVYTSIKLKTQPRGTGDKTMETKSLYVTVKAETEDLSVKTFSSWQEWA